MEKSSIFIGIDSSQAAGKKKQKHSVAVAPAGRRKMGKTQTQNWTHTKKNQPMEIQAGISWIH